MNKSTKIILIFLIIIGTLLVSIGAFTLYLNNQNSQNTNTSSSTPDLDEIPLATDETNQNQNEINSPETSELSELPDSSNINIISLVEFGVSFAVPDITEETDSPTVYKQYPQPDNCEYIGQIERELIILAYTSDLNCVDLTNFTSNGNTQIIGTDQAYILERLELQGSKDLLVFNNIEMGNNITLGFLYKDKFFDNTSDTISTVLDSFEIEITQ